jgi:hypothetical protein
MMIEWSKQIAAYDFHRGLDLDQRTDKVLAYYAEQLQAAYDRGRHDERRKNQGRIACEQCGGTGLAAE